MNLVGKIISNRYEILEEIGIGGMAYVYKAKCRLLNRFVAIKILKEEYSKDEVFVRKFKTEAQSAASLTHPNIVGVYDVGQDVDVKYIVMELLEGKTLKDYIKEKGKLSIDEAINILMDIAEGLSVAHKSHIIHRDIKPQNIILTREGKVKITDFGIAKMSSDATMTNLENTTMGSVHYFSPEQAKGGFTDERSDIYSLGIVMYEMVTGQVPFNSESSVSVAMQHITKVPEMPIDLNSKVSNDLNRVILKCISKSSLDRYKSVDLLLIDLNNCLDGVEITDTSDYTKVIPVINEDDIIPNLRTRKARRITTSSAPSKKKNNRGNKNKLLNNKVMLISGIVTFVILSIMLIIFSLNIINNMNGKEVKVYNLTVPNLIERDYEEVKAEYLVQGFEINQEKVEYHDTIKEGSIISQSQEKGVQTEDNVISVVVSKGQKLVTVPDVTDKDLKVVTYELEDSLGFKIEVEEVEHEEILSGIVISQEPEKDTEALYGSVIKLKVSKGDGKVRVIMPNVLNKTLEDAKKELEDLKLNVSVVYESDDSKDNGAVLKQSYPQNKELVEGDLVELTVNRVVKSSTFTEDLTEYMIFDEENTYYEIKVLATVDGGVENTVYTKTIYEIEDEENVVYSISFDINGYNSVSYKVLIDGEVKVTKEEAL